MPHHAEIFAGLARLGVLSAVVNGTCERDWPAVAALAEAHPGMVTPSYGLHPWYVAGRSSGWGETLRARLAADPGAAVGEIGLDRWKEPYDWADQQEVFRQQWHWAVELDRPVTVHCLRAWGALREHLRAAARTERGFLLHAYGGPAEMTRDFLDLGAYFSFNGYFLHERKAAQRDVFRRLPADRLLVETDAPAMPLPAGKARFELPPSGDGETLNHPANLVAVYEALAGLRGVTVEALARQVAANFRVWMERQGGS